MKTNATFMKQIQVSTDLIGDVRDWVARAAVQDACEREFLGATAEQIDALLASGIHHEVTTYELGEEIAGRITNVDLLEVDPRYVAEHWLHIEMVEA